MSEHIEIRKADSAIDAVCGRLERLGIRPRDRSECTATVSIMDSRGRHFLVTDILDRLIDLIERLERGP